MCKELWTCQDQLLLKLLNWNPDFIFVWYLYFGRNIQYSWRAQNKCWPDTIRVCTKFQCHHGRKNSKHVSKQGADDECAIILTLAKTVLERYYLSKLYIQVQQVAHCCKNGFKNIQKYQTRCRQTSHTERVWSSRNNGSCKEEKKEFNNFWTVSILLRWLIMFCLKVVLH